MHYPGDEHTGLVKGRLVRRYKRFLADIELDDGQVITVHCPNTGSMRGCATSGSRVWLSYSGNARRKYAYTWQLVENHPGELACIHSALANHIVAEALESASIPELAHYRRMQREVKFGAENSRIDFLLERPNQACFVEVKCVTLHQAQGEQAAGQGLFPDAVSQRGSRHLRELAAVKAQGARAVLLFCVMNSAIDRVSPAADIDPQYADTLRQVMDTGVEVLAYGTDINTECIKLAGALPFSISPGT